jgi:hypothetical protein
MTVKSDLPLSPLVTAIIDFKAEKVSEVIHKILQRPTVLVPGGAEALFNVVTNLTNLGDVCLKELAESRPWRMLTGGVIEVANQGKDLLEAEVHITALLYSSLLCEMGRDTLP